MFCRDATKAPIGRFYRDIASTFAASGRALSVGGRRAVVKKQILGCRMQIANLSLPTKRCMRWFATSVCLFLGNCSSSEYIPPLINAPSPSAAMAGAKAAANDAKFVGPVEVSAVREAHPIGPGRYLLCIRGRVMPPSETLIYAVFFNNNEYLTLRKLVALDDCESQQFFPLGNGPFPSVRP